MSEPLVSVLIPACDADPWIAETLASVEAQTWSNLEVIVVDGSSSDRTAREVEEHQAPNVRLIRRPDGAQSAAGNRNAALREARGEYLQFLDADDLLSPNKIRAQVERLTAEPGCVASAEWARFYESPEEAQFLSESVWTDLAPEAWLTAAWAGGGGMMQPGLWLIPHAVAENAGPWDERLTLIDDFEYFTRIVLASEGVRFCKGARLFYRSGNPQSLASRRSAAAWESALLALELGTKALLQRVHTDHARRACADQFQQLAYAAYLEHSGVSASAEAQVLRLGGSDAGFDGGALFTGLRQVLGWKTAKRVKQVAYSAGYDRFARAKRRVASRH